MGVFPPGVYEDGLNRVGNDHDGIAVGKAFVKFMAED